MQKSSYFPSPFRKDYTSKPLRNFNPVIIKEPSKPVSIVEQPQKEKTIKYPDGLLVNIADKGTRESGFFFTRNYSCMIFNLEQGRPHGQNYIIYLSGIVMVVNYCNGIINRWLVALLEEKFIMAYYFKKGNRDGLQYYYQWQSKLLVISEYRNGTLIKIRNGQIGEFEKLVNNKEIIEIVSELKQKNFNLDQKFPTLTLQNIKYFGELNNKKDNPHGYGILFGQKQLFMGNFTNGILNGIGGIRFGGGDFYYGQLNYGSCEGYGSVHYGKAVDYKFGNEQIQEAEFLKYLQIEFSTGSSDNWLEKFKDLDRFDYLFENICESTQASEIGMEENVEASEINLQIEDTISKREQLEFDQKTPPKKSQNIPKLSLFQQMKKKEKEQMIVDRSARVNQNNGKGIETDRFKNRTDRNERDQPKNILNTAAKPKKVPEKEVIEETNKKEKPKSEEQFIVEELGKDKWEVSKQYNFMKPNELEPKFKIDRNPKLKLTKSDMNPYLNMGKIMKTSSDVSDKQQDNFIKMIAPHQQE